ncbi:desumoylating isopeptidase 1 [Carex littledalei]|uniref:Desumoylating isopeptidase 1 n=1 Tax=Carex littledalei TaxID=544730 RepID=A0A833W2M5_9POAL|nr:desumoylating isopeptidase 1 [Carex littledalei]
MLDAWRINRSIWPSVRLAPFLNTAGELAFGSLVVILNIFLSRRHKEPSTTSNSGNQDMEEGYKVVLNVYDLSNGLAKQFSTAFLGKPIEAVWHTGIEVYGIEYYFSGGIQQSPAGATPFGTPLRVVNLGETHIPKDIFEEYLNEIAPRYTSETYSILRNNCNNFSNDVAQFLVGVTIPEYILNLPNEVMSSPMASLILPMIQQLEATLKSGGVPQAPEFRPSMPVQGPSQSSGTNADQNSTTNSSSTEKVQTKPHVVDPLGDVRNKVQQEIMKEFTAIMASGTIRASEAAALAARRVMQRHGNLDVHT